MILDPGYHRLRLQLWVQARKRPEPSPAVVLETRELFESIGRTVGIPDGFTCRAVDADGVAAEWMSGTGSSADRILFYLHGGAYSMGSVLASRTMLSLMLPPAAATGFNVDYRLAPEHPFPAAVTDAVTAYAWLVDRVPPGRVVVSGDSAGGGLAIAALVAARDRGLPMPAAAVVTSAWADLTLSGAAYSERASRDLALSPAGLRVAAELYLAGADPRHPLASPVFADLVGLPPLLVMVGTDEIVHDDSVRLAANAERAGVRVSLHVAEGMCHCWTGYARQLRAARRDLGRLGAFVQEHVGDAAG